MKKICLSLVAGLCLMLASGCATVYPVGSIYTQLKLPVDVTANNGATTKVGKANCVSYLGWFALGDASIETAKAEGQITEVHHVDWQVVNILGILGKYEVVVYGK